EHCPKTLGCGGAIEVDQRMSVDPFSQHRDCARRDSISCGFCFPDGGEFSCIGPSPSRPRIDGEAARKAAPEIFCRNSRRYVFIAPPRASRLQTECPSQLDRNQIELGDDADMRI